MKIDLNCDLGESFGNYKIGNDEEIIKYVTSVNIACGWHAGDANIMARTVKMALAYHTAIGAHPGFKDIEGFGRRQMDVLPDELKNYVKYQIGALNAFVVAEGGKMQHVKPHGAMYNMAAKDYALARAIAEAVYEVDNDLILMGLSGSALIQAGKDIGLATASEVFADRAYQEDGSLVPRSKKGALIHDKSLAIKRVYDMIDSGEVRTITGSTIKIVAETVCVHGDGQEALDFVLAIRAYMAQKQVALQNLR